MLAASCSLALATEKAPKDVPELVRFIRYAYDHVSGFVDEWNFSYSEDPITVIHYMRIRDGKRRRFEVGIQGNKNQNIINGSDGTTEFAVVPGSSLYYTGPATAESTRRLDAAANSAWMSIDEFGVEIVSKPAMKILFIRSEPYRGQPSRHLRAEARNPKSGGRVQLDITFWPNAWIMTSASLTTIRKSGETTVLGGRATRIAQNQKFSAIWFKPDPAMVKGFHKITRAELLKVMKERR